MTFQMDKSLNKFSYMKEMNCGTLENSSKMPIKRNSGGQNKRPTYQKSKMHRRFTFVD